MHFADRLAEAVKKKNSVICVGLDPRWDQLPKDIQEKFGSDFEGKAKAFLEFNKGIIDAVTDLVPVVKPQIAFYEALGHHGFWAFEETCKYAQEKGLLVIADAKRNDIGSTAAAYAETFLSGEVVQADALTVNGYLGLDGILPFVKMCDKKEKGIFILVKTSNPSSGDLQDRVTADENMSIAELMGHFVDSWGDDSLGEGYSAVGAVVGATFPAELEKLRGVMKKAWLLVPGYGAQGGGAEDVKAAFDENGLGAVVNSSRGIIFAYEKDGGDYKKAARAAVERMNDDLNTVR
jgi:orotidine-5'-phosphate decarboxylase